MSVTTLKEQLGSMDADQRSNAIKMRENNAPIAANCVKQIMQAIDLDESDAKLILPAIVAALDQAWIAGAEHEQAEMNKMLDDVLDEVP
jgi:hypothetical protein